MMEEAAARVAQDNCELACCFIQKTAVEKAGPEMDKRLATVSLVIGTFVLTGMLLLSVYCPVLYLMADCCTCTLPLL
jgi:hypothetical protein